SDLPGPSAPRMTAARATSHLAGRCAACLITAITEGRCRYFRLASPKVAQMLDGIMAVALDDRPRYRPLSRQGRELQSARICYDHLAGRLSVDLADFFIAREYLVFGDEAAEVTAEGSRFLTEFGVDAVAAGATRRRFCRSCLDWTERRPHIGGAIGAALANRCFDLGWAERMKDSRAVIITASGKRGFIDVFGIGATRAADAE